MITIYSLYGNSQQVEHHHQVAMHSSAEQSPTITSNGHSHPSTSTSAKTRTVVQFDLTPSQRFHLPRKKHYAPQYASIYFCRLTSLRVPLKASAQSTFGPPSATLRYAHRIVDAATSPTPDTSPVDTVIFGVIFRHMTSKPSILSLYDQPSHDLIPAPPLRATTPYPSPDDTIYLEDENGRCALDTSALSDPFPDSFATGFILAVRGIANKTTGAFEVSSFTSVQPAPIPPPRSPPDAYICLVSSLSLSTPSPAPHLLVEFLTGAAAQSDDPLPPASVAHLIIAGNLLPYPTIPPAHRPLSRPDKDRIADPIVHADAFLSAVAAALPVSVMPGENDPTNFLLPQQPLHRCLLPSASRNQNLSRVCNPFLCDIGGRSLLATSGQTVSDCALYAGKSATAGIANGNMKDVESKEIYEMSGERSLDILETMLNNRHIAPTCPDTLGCYPFSDHDPFVLEASPHIFVAGNQMEFATRLVKAPVQATQDTDDSMGIEEADARNVRLISVPRFDRTGQVVFVNLRSLDCTVREFATSI